MKLSLLSKQHFSQRYQQNMPRVIVSSDSSDNEEFDNGEFKKMLGKMFPSKHMKKEIEKMEKIDKKMNDKKVNKKKVASKNKVIETSSSDEEYIPTSDEEDETTMTESEIDSDEVEDLQKMNVVFTFMPTMFGAEESDESSSEESSSSEEEEEDKQIREIKTPKYKEIIDMMKSYQTDKFKGRDIFIKKVERIVAEEEKKHEAAVLKKIAKQEKEEKKSNRKKFRKLLMSRDVMDDVGYFDTLDVKNQSNIVEKLKELNAHDKVEKPYRISLIEADIPVSFKTIAIKKINSLEYMDAGDGEYYKVKHWVDGFMSTPFGKYQQLPLTMATHTIDEIHGFMENAKSTLDNVVYGMDDAKHQIMQMIGQWISNPNSVGTAIAIQGPMGTGKTTLVKDGISKILNRPFAFIPLGGATDSSFLEGHSYTYEGSNWGRIVDILIQSKCMNPVFYFDELDKVSDTPKGEEIIGILTHLTDTTQNSQFHDKYFSNIDFDLSKALFIFSYNDESKVNPILRDRMYRIKTDGYKAPDKQIIATNYLLPKIRDAVNIGQDEIIIPTETIDYINAHLTESEKGVRNLKRCLEIIHTKLNLYRLMKPGANVFDNTHALKVTFPFTVTPDVVDVLIKKTGDTFPVNMYC
jgi:ATP-dependent Lon protease